MIDTTPPTSVELRELGRAALRTEPSLPFVGLFPHLSRVRDQPIDRPVQASKRLLSVLDAWHGRTWRPYLLESPAAMMRRRNAGATLLGEFIQIAIAAADPDAPPAFPKPAKSREAPPEPAPPATNLAPVRQARVFLADLKVVGAIPDGPTLRDIARSTLAFGGDIPFQGLFPYLPEFADEVIDARGEPAAKLLSVFSKWRGFRWGSYLAESPASFLRQRNGGLTGLGAVLWLGARLATVERPEISADGPSDSTPDAELEAQIGPVDQADAIERIAVLVDRSTERELAILRWRLATLGKRKTLAELGVEFGCTRERVRQVEERLKYRIGREIARRDSVARMSALLRDGIGAAWSADGMADLPGIVEPALIDLSRVETKLLLWSAGPYELLGGWLVRRPAGGTVGASKRMLRAAISDGPISIAEAIQHVSGLGIRPRIGERWIGALDGFRVMDGKLIRERPRRYGARSNDESASSAAAAPSHRKVHSSASGRVSANTMGISG